MNFDDPTDECNACGQLGHRQARCPDVIAAGGPPKGRPPGQDAPATEVVETYTVDDVAALARKHTKKAIRTLAKLMACRGRQSMVAAVASTALLKLANVDEERIKQLVEERVKALIAEAQQRKQLPAAPGAR